MTIKKKNDAVDLNQDCYNQDQKIWQQFVQMVCAHVDPVLASILYATDLIVFDKSRRVVEVVTLKKFILFQDLFLEQKHIYQQYLDKIFGYQVVLVVQFTKIEVKQDAVQSKKIISHIDANVVPVSVNQQKSVPVLNKQHVYKKSMPAALSVTGIDNNERAIDISDKNTWKITHTLLHHFGGTVREIIRDTLHEFDA